MKIDTEPEPKIGETRVRSGFALWPKTISPMRKVWLERYEITEMYHQPMPIPNFTFYPHWAIFDNDSKTVFEDRRVFMYYRGWVKPGYLIQRSVPPVVMSNL